MTGLPQLALTYYGDDFTGSTDVMEAMTAGGVPTVLFLDAPDAADLAAFPAARAVGVAGVARAKPPAWMDEHLPTILARLHRLGAGLLQYKVCSTFDSSPQIGSIGRALDIGRRVTGAATFTPIVVGAPALKRYVLFGNLFASVGAETFRLDRHPTMSRHPVTPMRESDLVRHLADQSRAVVARCDLLALTSADPAARLEKILEARPDAVLFDSFDAASLERVGAMVWAQVRPGMYAVASSGLNYALAAHWQAAGLVQRPPSFAPPSPADRIVIVSGSCSPTTAAQIGFAEAAGFAAIRLDPRSLIEATTAAAAITGARDAGLAALQAGRSVVVFTARGPDDPAVAAFESHRAGLAIASELLNERVGEALGLLLKDLLLATGIRRAMICGGDTSGPAARSLGLHALTMRAPLVPGSPLCEAHVRDPRLAGLEIALKGGQVGGPDYFVAALGGRR